MSYRSQHGEFVPATLAFIRRQFGVVLLLGVSVAASSWYLDHSLAVAVLIGLAPLLVVGALAGSVVAHAQRISSPLANEAPWLSWPALAAAWSVPWTLVFFGLARLSSTHHVAPSHVFVALVAVASVRFVVTLVPARAS